MFSVFCIFEVEYRMYLTVLVMTVSFSFPFSKREACWVEVVRTHLGSRVAQGAILSAPQARAGSLCVKGSGPARTPKSVIPFLSSRALLVLSVRESSGNKAVQAL